MASGGDITRPRRAFRRACLHLSDFLFGAAVVVSAVGFLGLVIWGVGGFLAELARFVMSHAAS